MRPDVERPYRLPDFVRWVALAIFAFWMVVYWYGGFNAPHIVVGPDESPFLFVLGLLIMCAYFPLYWWRAASDRRNADRIRSASAPRAVGATTKGQGD
jgi:hypothetical protein